MTARLVLDARKRLHIYVVDKFPSYSETFVATEINSLLEQGTAVAVYSIHPPEARFEGVTGYVAQPKSMALMVPWVLPGLVLLAFNFKHGLRFDIRSFPKLIFAAAHAARLALAVRSKNAENALQVVLHAHFLARPADVVGLAGRWLPGVPVLVTSHAGDAKDRRDQRLRRWRIGRADHVLAASQFVLNNLGDEPRKASIIHCGIDTMKLPQSADPGTVDGLVIATVARLIATKGYDRAMGVVLALAARSSTRVTWHVVGEGPMRRDFESAAQRFAAAGVQVVLHGALNHDSTLRIIGRCSVFLLPSQITKSSENSGDGIPVAILEGMALRKLVVTTGAGGIPEAVIDNETGLLLSTDSHDEAADRILSILNDKRKYKTIVDRAQHKISAEFEASKSASSIQDIVASILSDDTLQATRDAKTGSA